MDNEQRKFMILDGITPLIEAFEYRNDANSDAVYLIGLDGWDNFANIEVETAPKGIGAGSYMVYTRVGEREITADFNVNSVVDVKIYLDMVKTKMLTMTPVRLIRTYSKNNVENLQEDLDGYITAVTWERIEENATLTVTVKCLNPIKTTYLNDSTTPEGAGSL